MLLKKNGWHVVYDKAIRKDGSLFFPERLSHEVLADKRQAMGSYVFANQLLNEIIPAEDQEFKTQWLKYFDELPTNKNTFIFIDPAISSSESSDYTAIVIVDVDAKNDWFVRAANRYKMSPTAIIDTMFKLNEKFKPRVMGIEKVAFQESILHFLKEEMRRRNVYIPVHGYHPGTTRTKEDRIRGLIPRFEWGNIYLKRGLQDLEDEMAKFPRSQHDDLLDALASLQEIAYAPSNKNRGTRNEKPSANDPNYEKWYIQQLQKGKAKQS